MKRTVYGFGIIAVGLLCAYIATTTALGTWLHIVTNIFAGGRSTTKTIGLLIFLAFCFEAYYFRTYLPSGPRAHVKKLLAGTVLGLFLLGMCGHVYIVLAKQGNVLNEYIFFNQQEISSSSLGHNHVLKGSVGVALTSLGLSWQENIDIGTPFLPLLPWFFFIITGIGLVCVSLCAILLSAEMVGEKPRLHLLCWSIVSFVVIKNIVDGGLLNSETLITLVFWLCLLFQLKRHIIPIMLAALTGSLLITTLLLWGHGDPEDGSLLLHAISQTISLGLFWICAALWLYNLSYARLRVLVLMFTLLTLVPTTWRDIGVTQYNHTLVTSADTAYVSSFQPLTGLTPVNKVGPLTTYTLTPNTTTTIDALAQEHGLLDNFYPVLVEWQQCFPTGEPHIYSFTLITTTAPQTQWSNGTIHMIATTLPEAPTHYAVSVRIPQCYPRPLNIIHQVLRENNQNIFRITDLKSNF